MFEYLVLFTATILASSAAWFSVTGIVQLFSGAPISIAIMASALELSKIVGVSVLYRYKSVLPKIVKYYLNVGIFVLMVITSIGIYGYLSNAYATSATEIQQKENDVDLYKSQQQTIENVISDLTNRKSKIEATIIQQENRLDELVKRGRGTATQQQIIREQNRELKDIQSQIVTYTKTKDSLQVISVQKQNSIGSTSGKLGTFYYVAQSMGVELDTIVKWFILILVIVFDPMSIVLFVSYNSIKVKNKNKFVNIKTTSDIAPTDVSVEPTLETNNESTMPYYMVPGYDWNNDHRWETDPAAKGYRSNLGKL